MVLVKGRRFRLPGVVRTVDSKVGHMASGSPRKGSRPQCFSASKARTFFVRNRTACLWICMFTLMNLWINLNFEYYIFQNEKVCGRLTVTNNT